MGNQPTHGTADRPASTIWARSDDHLALLVPGNGYRWEAPRMGTLDA
jgi:hypothetical protein